MSEPLLAAIAESKHSRELLAYRVRLSLALMITVLMPVTTFIMLYPELIIRVLLGTQWLEYASLLEPFGLFFFSFCLFALISNAIIAQGRVQFLFWFDLVSTICILALLLWFATGSLSDMAWWRGWLAIATTIALLVALETQTGFNIGRLLFLTLPAALASAVSAGLTTYLELPWEAPIIDLLVRGSVFVLLASLLIAGLASLLLRGTPEWQQLLSMTRSLPGLTVRKR